MHPPFFHVDHKIGPDIHHHGDSKILPKRAQPARLVLQPATPTAWPPVPMVHNQVPGTGPLHAPSGQLIKPQPVLQIVPPPARTLRQIIGRFLIRAGQRMIMESRA